MCSWLNEDNAVMLNESISQAVSSKTYSSGRFPSQDALLVNHLGYYAIRDASLALGVLQLFGRLTSCAR
jgi:hypothetical protein